MELYKEFELTISSVIEGIYLSMPWHQIDSGIDYSKYQEDATEQAWQAYLYNHGRFNEKVQDLMNELKYDEAAQVWADMMFQDSKEDNEVP